MTFLLSLKSSMKPTRVEQLIDTPLKDRILALQGFMIWQGETL
jgi:hypothetical protein